MILLTATAIDVFGQYRFTIECADAARRVTTDAARAARILLDMGVEDPRHLVDHSRQWGSVEIVEPASAQRMEPEASTSLNV